MTQVESTAKITPHHLARKAVVYLRLQWVWQLPIPSFLKDVLGHPLYAGAYVVGRRPI